VNNPALDTMVGEGGAFGRGGMITKLRAARLAARSGTTTVIASGANPNVIPAIAAGQRVGTYLAADTRPQSARKQWLASLMHAKGTLVLDGGAVDNVVTRGRSLLPIGVVSVEGEFARGELVRCVDETGREIARGLVNYGAHEARLLLRRSSADIPSILGYGGDAEMIHRDNLVRV